MAEKTYRQMERDFRELYFKEIKPLLADNEKRRKKNAINLVIGMAILIFFFVFVLACILENIIIAFFSFLIFVSAIVYMFFANGVKKLPDGSYQIQGDSNADFESEIKKVLMQDFLNIFTDSSSWSNASASLLPDEKIQLYRETNIFNVFRHMLLDDAIHFVFKDTEVDIYELNNQLPLIVKVVIAILVMLIAPLALVYLILILLASSNLLIILFIPASVIIFWQMHELKKELDDIGPEKPKINMTKPTLMQKITGSGPFTGLAIELSMNKKFKGHTIFIDNSRQGKKVPIDKKFESVSLESVDFHKKYTVYSTDQIEARYMLTSSMIERLLNLEFTFRAKYIRGSFKDNKLILIIHTNRDMLEMGSNFKEAKLKTFTQLFEEIVSILKIIDQFKLDEKTGL